MTPQEALAQALRRQHREGPSMRHVPADATESDAAAILAALPKGWRLIEWDWDLYQAASQAGAEQERERLRALVEAIEPACHSRSGLNCEDDEYGWCYLISRADVLALLAEPQP